MKSCVLLLAFCFNSLFSISQKIVKVSKDKFTNGVEIATSIEKVATNLYIYGTKNYSAEFDFSEYFLIFQFKSNSFELLDGEGEIKILLENGEVITDFDKGGYRTYSPGDKIDFYFWAGMGEDPNDNIKKLCENKITDIRIETFKHQFDFSISEIDRKKIKTIANLIYNYKIVK